MNRNNTLFPLVVLGCSATMLGAQCAVQPGAVPVPSQSVLTYHYDTNRSGLNDHETVLTQANVNSAQFGKVAFYALDGGVQAQPLIVTSTYNGGTVHALYAATEHDSVYRIDADTGAQVWKTSLLATGESPSPPQGEADVTEIGVMGTPVIDLSAGPNGAIYLIGRAIDSGGTYHHKLHALDLCTGGELFSGPTEIAATYPGTGDGSSNGVIAFDSKQYVPRAGLSIWSGTIYTLWSSHGDARPYTGWVMAYDSHTLKQTGVLNVTPNGNEGAMWMAGAAPAIDSKGFVYIGDGNGTFDTTFDERNNPADSDYGDTLFKMGWVNGKLSIIDWFVPRNVYYENSIDKDLGAGGVMLLPSQDNAYGRNFQLTISGGKTGNLYVNDRNQLGKFNPQGGNVYQELGGEFQAGLYTLPAFFNNTIYYVGNHDYLKAFSFTGARMSTSPVQMGTMTYSYPGATPVVSANGSRDGIVWTVANNKRSVLHANAAQNINQELYNSSQAANGRDSFGGEFHFIAPVEIGGKVFIGTGNGIAVFGLLP